MRVYLKETDYKDYSDDYPIKNIKKQYDIYCKQKMYFDTNKCMTFCRGKCISKYSDYSYVLEVSKLFKKMNKEDLIKYCVEWEFRGFMLARQQYYLKGGKITGY